MHKVVLDHVRVLVNGLDLLLLVLVLRGGPLPGP
jgi:hypothetical protein